MTRLQTQRTRPLRRWSNRSRRTRLPGLLGRRFSRQTTGGGASASGVGLSACAGREVGVGLLSEVAEVRLIQKAASEKEGTFRLTFALPCCLKEDTSMSSLNLPRPKYRLVLALPWHRMSFPPARARRTSTDPRRAEARTSTTAAAASAAEVEERRRSGTSRTARGSAIASGSESAEEGQARGRPLVPSRTGRPALIESEEATVTAIETANGSETGRPGVRGPTRSARGIVTRRARSRAGLA